MIMPMFESGDKSAEYCKGWNDAVEAVKLELARGEMVSLPCPIGTQVYVVGQYHYDVDGYGMQFEKAWGVRRRAFTLGMFGQIGETVFLSEGEAWAEVERKCKE